MVAGHTHSDRGDDCPADRPQQVPLSTQPTPRRSRAAATRLLSASGMTGITTSPTPPPAPSRCVSHRTASGPPKRAGPRSELASRRHAGDRDRPPDPTRRRPRSWTRTSRVVTSNSAIETSATGQAAALTWLAMLKSRTACPAPWSRANTNTSRDEIPATNSNPASQPTRAYRVPRRRRGHGSPTRWPPPTTAPPSSARPPDPDRLHRLGCFARSGRRRIPPSPSEQRRNEGQGAAHAPDEATTTKIALIR